jgi:hypothetical protein
VPQVLTIFLFDYFWAKLAGGEKEGLGGIPSNQPHWVIFSFKKLKNK